MQGKKIRGIKSNIFAPLKYIKFNKNNEYSNIHTNVGIFFLHRIQKFLGGKKHAVVGLLPPSFF